MKKPSLLFIVGPTASGKSEVAIALAKKIDGEILSADSMLVYRGMDIGTAKPKLSDRRHIPHHGIDLLPHTKNFSVFKYRQYALKSIKVIVKRGRIPIVVGGSGLYIRALLEGLVHSPGAERLLRKKLEKQIAEKGLAILYKKLSRVDPQRAAKISPNDQKRIIRALEIHLLSGRKPSAFSKSEPSLKQLGYAPFVIGIHRDRQALYEKIERRVERMFKNGLVLEVKRLARKPFSQTALQGVGYKEVLNALRKNEAVRDWTRVKDKIKLNTRHFAKRQWTWFKREKGIHWVWWPENVPVRRFCEFILEQFGRKIRKGNSVHGS